MDILDLVHEDRSAAARPFACPDLASQCHKTFARRSDLVRHLRIHTNERPFQCDWPGCHRDFIQRSALTVHYRVHSGERPHHCEYRGCGKAFSDSSSLARHRRIHTGKRPYRCQVPTCLKTFCRKTTLTKHIKRNHPGAGAMPTRFEYESDDETPPGTPSVDGYRIQSHSMTSGSSHSSYHMAPEEPYYAPPFVPHLAHLEEQDARNLRSHLRDDVVYAPPPVHPRHMQEHPPVQYEASMYHQTHPHYQQPHVYYAPPPHPNFTSSALPPIHSLISQRHFSGSAPPSPLYHLAPVPGPHSYLAPYPSPTTPSQRSPVDDCYISQPFPHPSSPHRGRRVSSASAADFSSMQIQRLDQSSCHGIADHPPRRYSELAEEVEYSTMAPPMSPLGAAFAFRPRRKSSISFFPSISSLPPSRQLSHRGSFSSFVTQHIEEMEAGAAPWTG